MPDLPTVVTTIADLRAAVAAARAAGRVIGLVPTMGALHEGHAELVRAAARVSGFVVVSVFVNPTQFGPAEDFAKYPRTLDADRAICGAAGAHLVFAPPVEEVYPPGAVTFVEVPKLDASLCGPSRPGHFRGVCTVVLKLFNMALPDVAVFGQKDAQQARIIRQMVRDLNVPVDVRIEPTVREADGLAMSSRNRYLSPADRALASGIYRALRAVRDRALAGEWDVARLESALRADLVAIPGARIDYASIVDDDTLQPIARLDRPALAAVAVFLGTTRLIDNVTIP
ncbi:pantoate--beta-alanine ligase [Fimbriiglobus ruber]|uniref:Pantothenate synthetase n=1 Tax=Fimbriiglobus ruber TaxID=1908690 RepID=A0A225DJN5_9BACT|nr:pantoate--beta-alanine ligase [Fimbriiglobus ruber]OWK41671.1 Pantoate--beta-alanine ligase [Fimbriiglobus ruber]